MKSYFFAALTLLLSFNLWAGVETKLSNDLTRTSITYEFSNGQVYNVKFLNDEQLSYRFVSGSNPDKWWGRYEYKAQKVSENEYFFAWYEDGYYATVLFNRKTKEVFGSSIAGENTYFLKGKIIE